LLDNRAGSGDVELDARCNLVALHHCGSGSYVRDPRVCATDEVSLLDINASLFENRKGGRYFDAVGTGDMWHKGGEIKHEVGGILSGGIRLEGHDAEGIEALTVYTWMLG
jgi:hypothetical protein